MSIEDWAAEMKRKEDAKTARKAAKEAATAASQADNDKADGDEPAEEVSEEASGHAGNDGEGLDTAAESSGTRPPQGNDRFECPKGSTYHKTGPAPVQGGSMIGQHIAHRFDIGWAIGFVKGRFTTARKSQLQYHGMYEVVYPNDPHTWYHALGRKDYGADKTWVQMKKHEAAPSVTQRPGTKNLTKSIKNGSADCD